MKVNVIGLGYIGLPTALSLAAGGLDAIVRLHALSRSLMGRLDRSFAAVMGINSALLAAGIVGIIRPQTSALLHNGTTIALAAESARRHSLRHGYGKTHHLL